MTDKEQDFKEAYDLAHMEWANYIAEAKRDMKAYLGDQWDSADKAYLASLRRNALVFNRIKRVVKIICGYQSKNRLTMKIDPIGMEDSSVASQLSNLVMQTMLKTDGYEVMSEAFLGGPVITGLNLVDVYIDPTSQFAALKRMPYNNFLLDPSFTQRDLSDCQYIIRREMVTRDEAKMLLPGHDSAINDLPEGRDGMFNDMPAMSAAYADNMLSYDEFYRRRLKKVKVIIDRRTGTEQEFLGTSAQLKYLLDTYPTFSTIDRWRKTIEMNIYIQGKHFHTGPDPYGFDDYRFVPLIGYYHPEDDDVKYRLQGVVRAVRDPQREFNKRISQELDIIERQITTGYDAIEETVVNPESLLRSGQGEVTWIKKAGNEYGLDSIRKKQIADIPPGLFQLNQSIDQLLTEIPGINEELFGTEEKEIPGILSRLRQGGALTILQDLFDNYRFAKRLLGRKLITIIQKNYRPRQIQRMLNEPPHPALMQADLSRCDVTVQEGLLTDTQRQMYYEELKALQAMGAPIPWSAIIDAAPIQLRDHLKQHVAQNEKEQQELLKQRQKLEELSQKLMQSQISENVAQAKERTAQIQENIAGAELDRAKTAAEIQALQTKSAAVINEIKHPKKQAITKR